MSNEGVRYAVAWRRIADQVSGFNKLNALDGGDLLVSPEYRDRLQAEQHADVLRSDLRYGNEDSPMFEVVKIDGCIVTPAADAPAPGGAS